MSTLAHLSPSHLPDIGPDIIVAPPAATPSRHLPWRKIILGAAALAIAAAGVGRYLYYSAGFESTDDAFLDGNVHPVSSRINGTVARVLVNDNAHVDAGQPLVELDPADLDLAVQGSVADLAQALANADQVAAQISRAEADSAAAAARIAQNAAQVTRASLDFKRMEILASDKVGAISQQDFELARATLDSARAVQQSLEAELASAKAALAAAHAQQSVAGAQIQKAESSLAAAKLQAGYTVIRAPSSGHVAKKSVEVGQRLQPGQPMMSIVSDQVWVVANFKEGQLAHLHVGAPVEISVDALEGRRFQGTVDSFSPGTGAKFSLLPPDNATGNFVKVVQRIPVRIHIDSDTATLRRMRPGMSVDVVVHTK